MVTETREGFADVDAIIRRNKDAGYHFFDADTLRWFKSKIDHRLAGGRWFVTSEKCEMGAYVEPRQYTVREALTTGQIETFGEIGAYATMEKARRVARDMAIATEQAPRCRTCDKRITVQDGEATGAFGYAPVCRYCNTDPAGA